MMDHVLLASVVEKKFVAEKSDSAQNLLQLIALVLAGLGPRKSWSLDLEISLTSCHEKATHESYLGHVEPNNDTSGSQSPPFTNTLTMGSKSTLLLSELDESDDGWVGTLEFESLGNL